MLMPDQDGRRRRAPAIHVTARQAPLAWPWAFAAPGAPR